MFRLELLENIFSLLFLSSADLTQQTQKGTSSNIGNSTRFEYLSGTKNTNGDLGNTASTFETEYIKKENQKQHSTAACHGHLDMGHFVQGCKRFLADVTAMEGFLKLLKEGLEGVRVVGHQDGQEVGRTLLREARVAERLGCSVTAETFGTRLQRLTKRIAEAQWRLQIITSNQGSGSGEMEIIYRENSQTFYKCFI